MLTPCPKCGGKRHAIKNGLENGRQQYRASCRACDGRRHRSPEKSVSSVRAWEARNPEKKAAHLVVSKALRRGLLHRSPCERCGACKVDAHHEDYAKPLEVTWLCRACHKQRHRELRGEEIDLIAAVAALKGIGGRPRTMPHPAYREAA
jgi:hypothetical protein